ncbi:hypothetical protein LR48_Vigan11g062500 [Vigna angularis]|uniref:Uncharacterized protein n=1 Tax=Phaseolus angularis TaxID=3914 RepID=A0A0L9VRV0_PHAAN|nr:hypothetical protein LR48_Vigan11g062500 [Vigna angularis]
MAEHGTVCEALTERSTEDMTEREVEVNIPQFDYAVDDYVVHDYAVDRYVEYCIVDEHAFNSPSLRDENHFLLSHLNVYSPCTKHEYESVVDIASKFELDSCSEGISKVHPVTLGLGVIPMHVISLEPHCTNPIVGDLEDSTERPVVSLHWMAENGTVCEALTERSTEDMIERPLLTEWWEALMTERSDEMTRELSSSSIGSTFLEFKRVATSVLECKLLDQP